MATCELCGTDGVSTRSIQAHGTFVEACRNCQAKMGISQTEETAVKNVQKAVTRRTTSTSGGYGGLGTAGKDIMVRGEKELVKDFSTKIRESRERRGWNQRTLALKMKEKINIIQRCEAGQRPTDSVAKKFEKTLGIKLFSESADVEFDRVVGNKNARSMNLGDYLNMAKREEK